MCYLNVLFECVAVHNCCCMCCCLDICYPVLNELFISCKSPLEEIKERRRRKFVHFCVHRCMKRFSSPAGTEHGTAISIGQCLTF